MVCHGVGGSQFGSELGSGLRKVVVFGGAPNQCFKADSLRDFTDDFKASARKGEVKSL